MSDSSRTLVDLPTVWRDAFDERTTLDMMQVQVHRLWDRVAQSQEAQ